MKKKRWIILLVITGLVLGGLYVFKGVGKKDDITIDISGIKVTPMIEQVITEDTKSFGINPYPLNNKEKQYKKLLEEFLKNKMLVNGTFVTNYKMVKNPSKTELATGHDRLSESSGLWLRHLALTGQKEAYDQFYRETKKYFYKNGQFSYRLNADGTLSPVNASLDDLRIMRSLIEASNQFQDPWYEKELKILLKTFKKQSIQGNVMIDFYDTSQKEAGDTISLYYLSIKTMGYLYKEMNIDSKYLEYQYNILKDGYISDDFPFYYAQYSYKNNRYVDKDTINVIESLLSILYLSEIGKEKQSSIEFIKEMVTTGTLYNSYDKNGNPVDKSQSAASYAIAAMIGREVGDEDLYQRALNIVRNFQITDPQNLIYGGIGDPTTHEVFSYNNLMAMLAYDY